MQQVYEDYLFTRGFFVREGAADADAPATFAEALVALAHFARIRIDSRPELADLHMLQVAQRNLGCDVPAPFYKGFPKSVYRLSRDRLLLDQLIHYSTTYGMGIFDEAGHSLFEELYERAAFSEDVEPSLFAIIPPDEAEAMLARAVDGMLSSTRPLNDVSYGVLLQYLKDHGAPVRPCGCKDTVCRLLLDLRDPGWADLLALPDTIRLVEWMLEYRYPDMTLRKLNLRNQDRKLVSAVLDRVLARDMDIDRFDRETTACLEKKRAWNGLLHHIHYRPTSPRAERFCDALRGRDARSAYSEFELLVASGEAYAAARALRSTKGPNAVLRNLAYLVSRCESAEEADRVLELARTTSKIVLIQLLTHFSATAATRRRAFKFVHLNRMSKHDETDQEMARRKSSLDAETTQRITAFLRDELVRACRGTLGRVYADDALRNIALPLQEAASMGGYGTLPRGSRIPLREGKKLRAFVYWEKVDDIDLSCFGLRESGEATEFSWRTMADRQSQALTYSGDQTSGFKGGSEYFDIDLPLFRKTYDGVRYVVFCANVYSWNRTFSTCTCRAGYMLRDEQDSGEVFEPKTVKSSFSVNCASSSAYLFALDLDEGAFVWLNIAEDGGRSVAGEGNLGFLLDYMHRVDAMNLRDFARLLATSVVEAPEEADVVFSDAELVLRHDQEQIRSWDTERILELLNG